MKPNDYSQLPSSPHANREQSLDDGFHLIGALPRSKFVQPTTPTQTRPAPQPEPEELASAETELAPRRLNWQAIAIFLVLCTGGIGFTATALLLKSPAVPNCPQIFLPTASASMRLYCAQLAANKGTIPDLMEALQLVQNLPVDHPLYPEIERYTEIWIEELLRLGESTFQEGNLEEAINLATQISSQFDDPTLIQGKIQRWQEIWDEAEAIEAEALAQMDEGLWGQAFQTAAGLTQLDNRYWATTRYDQLFETLNTAREESKKLDAVFAQVDQGGLDNLLAAIATAQQVPKTSSTYNEAQTLINRAKEKLVELAMVNLRQGRWQAAMQVVNKIPSTLRLEDEIADISTLADAVSVASFGTQINYEDAIATAREIAPGRPLYNQAQELISRWQDSIEGGLSLDAAIALARGGTQSALEAAISQARTVPQTNPRYAEAQGLINDWTRQIERTADQPILDAAAELARAGNLEGAIQRARQVSSGRGLYGEAQEQIDDWQRQLEREEDRPTLDRAIALANRGQYLEAIQVAQQIASGRSLYGEAQRQIEGWQQEVRGAEQLAQATQRAQAGTPEALRAAIELAQQVPSNSRQGATSRQRINQWSGQILAIARQRSGSSLAEAVAIARLVPPNTAAYSAAQAQIETWNRLLNPSTLPPIPESP
jgi:hypothetical protein